MNKLRKLIISRFVDLQTLMGESYKEGITIDEINTFLSDKKFADLSTGAYVDKNKYEADIKAKNDEIKQYKETIKSKMSDDEQKLESEKEKDQLIESLKQQILASNIQNAKSSAESILAETKSLLGITDDDKAYSAFVDSISSDNLENTKTLAKYIGKLVHDSYEKGKKDFAKDSLGKFSNGVDTSSSTDGKVLALGTELAKLNTSNKVDSELYFKN